MLNEVRNRLESVGIASAIDLHNSQPDAIPRSKACFESWSVCHIISASSPVILSLYHLFEKYSSAEPLENKGEQVLHRVDIATVLERFVDPRVRLAG